MSVASLLLTFLWRTCCHPLYRALYRSMRCVLCCNLGHAFCRTLCRPLSFALYRTTRHPLHRNLCCTPYRSRCCSLTNKYNDGSAAPGSRFSLFPGYMERYQKGLVGSGSSSNTSDGPGGQY